MTSTIPAATVFIPTFNGEKYLKEVLDAVFSQKADFDYEVLIIDSGSRDKTLDLVRHYPARLIEIPNEEFGHGRTRNLAVELALGSHVAFLTQDATPADDRWLHHLVGAFDIATDVAASYGPHLTRPDADPKTVRDQADFFAGMGPPDAPTIHRDADIVFFSDVNSCVRKDIWHTVPFRDLPYAEDQALGKDLLAAGYAKVFEPRAAVIHSHSYPPVQYVRRMFDEWKGLKVAIGAEYSPRLSVALYQSVRGIRSDVRHILKLPQTPLPRRIKWLWRAVTANITRNLTSYLVEHETRLPGWLVERISYERWLKRDLPR